ncbi:MAG: NAD-dependent epimerase/dehydratase family protein [Chloroflexota bacterium]
MTERQISSPATRPSSGDRSITTALVTGGAGFIGSNLVRRLLHDGTHVVVLDDFSSGRMANLPRVPNLTIVEGDLTQVDDLEGLVREAEVVFHLAAQVGTIPAILDPVHDARVNVLGTVRLLAACRGTSVRRIVCSSSAAPFGEAQAARVAEDHPQHPESFYALSKLAAERYALLAASLLGLPTVCLRYFNVYGLPLSTSEYAGVISIFLDKLRRGEPIRIFGDGSQSRDFVYVKDVVTANLLAARHGVPGGIYNIGTGWPTTVLELATLMSELAGRTPEIEFLPRRPGEIQHSTAAIDAARGALGYAPAYDLRTGLAEIWKSAWNDAHQGG